MRMCWTAGWGSHGGISEGNTPLEVALNVFPHDYCTEFTDTPVLKYDQFCAGVPDHDENGEARVKICTPYTAAARSFMNFDFLTEI